MAAFTLAELSAHINITGIKENADKMKLLINLFELAGGKSAKFDVLATAIKAVGDQTRFTADQARQAVAELERIRGSLLSGKDILNTGDAVTAGRKFGNTLIHSMSQGVKENRSEMLAAIRSTVRDPSLLSSLNIKPRFDFTNVRNLRNEISEVATRIQALQDPVKRFGASWQLVRKIYRDFNTQIKSGTLNLRQQREAAIALGDQIRRFSKGTVPTGVGGFQVDSRQLQTLDNLTSKHQKYYNNLAATTKETQKQEVATRKLTDQQHRMTTSIGIAVGKLIRYRVAFFVMRGAIQGVQSALQEFIDLQFQLADLQKIIDRQTESIEKYRDAAFEMSKTFGVAVKDVTDTLRIFVQTGLEASEAIEAVKATLVGVNALGGTTKQVVEALTAAIFTYGVAVEDLTVTISKWLAVQKDFPINAQDIANSLKVVGAAAQVVGVDLDDLAGFIAAIGASTRKSGTAIGQSLKTIFARVPRAKVIKAFEGLNIAVLKSASELRDFDDVLFDLSKQWNKLDTVQKANISTTLGGIRRYSDFIALMDNYDIKLAATIQAQKASTEALDANQLAIQTFKKQFDIMKASMGEFAVLVGQIFIGPLNNLVKAFNSVIKVLGGLNGWFAKAIAIITMFIATAAGIGIVIASGRFIVEQTIIVYGKWTGATIAQTSANIGLGTSSIVAADGVTTLGTAVAATAGILSTTSGILFVIAIALATVATAIGFFAGEASVASEYVGDFSGSISQSVRVLQTQADALDKQIELISNLGERFNKAADNIANAGGDEIKISKEMVEFTKILNIVPEEAQKLRYELSKLSDISDLTAESIATINKELDDFSSKTILAAKRANELAESERIAAIASLRKHQEEVKKLRKEYEKTVSDLPDIIVKMNLEEAIGEIPDYLFNIPRVRKELRKQLEEVIDLYEDNLDLFEQKAKDINKIFEGEITPPIIFDRDAIEDQIKKMNFENIFKLAQKQALIAVRDDDALDFADEIIKSFGTIIQRRFDIVEKSLTKRGLLSGVVSALKKDASETTRILNGLIDIGREDKGEFLIGATLSKEVVLLEKSFINLIKKFNSAGAEFNDLKKTLKFDEILDPKTFTFEKAITFINGFNEKLRETKTSLSINKEIVLDIQTVLDRISEKGKLFGDDVETRTEVRDLLKDIGIDTAVIAQGEAKIQDALIAELKTRNLSIIQIKEILDTYSKMNSEVKSGLNLIKEYNKLDTKNLALRGKISRLRDFEVDRLEYQLSIVEQFPRTQREQIALEEQKLRVLTKANLAIANAETDAGKKREANIKALNKNLDLTVKTMRAIKDIRIEDRLDNAIESAVVLEDALSDAFENIAPSIVEDTEERRELSKDLRKAEFELQEARKEGDKESIAQAQYRIDLVKYEMDQYRSGLKQVLNVFRDVFATISDALNEQLAEDLAESIADIKIGDSRMGEIVSDAILKGGGKFTENFRTTVDYLNTEYFIKLENVYTVFLFKLNEVLESGQFANLPEGGLFTTLGSNILEGAIPPEEQINTVRLEDEKLKVENPEFELQRKLIQDQLKLQGSMLDVDESGWRNNKNELINTQVTIKSGFILLSNTVGTLVGGGGQGAAIGSSLGGAIGIGVAGPVGGFIGSALGGLFGGLFDKDDEPLEPLIPAFEDLTRATIENTFALRELDKSIFNAPTRFNIPAANQQGFGRSIQINITTTGGNAEEIAAVVRDEIGNVFDEESGSYGTRGYVPI